MIFPLVRRTSFNVLNKWEGGKDQAGRVISIIKLNALLRLYP
jgi:hypothetical protein